MKTLAAFFTSCICISANAQLTLVDSFDPAETGSLCGIGYDPDSSHIWVYECFGSQIHCYDTTGTYVKSFNIGGETANDVDFDFSSENFALDGSTVNAFDIIFINGETDAAELYIINRSSGEVTDTLHASFGVGHTVGGSWHHDRNTFFLVEDNVPSPPYQNTVAEIDPETGDTLQTFYIGSNFNVSYGDLEVCTESGNLFIVSSEQLSVGEFTPDGDFVEYHDLPGGVNGLSGIAMDYTQGTAWVSSTNGTVYLLNGINCTCTVSEATIDATTCDEYVSPSGLYVWDQDGTYQDVLINSGGCDSLLTINLNVVEIDTSVTVSLGMASANANDAEYLWLNCENDFSSMNTTTQDFVVFGTGTFAVQITIDGCTDTSGCHEIIYDNIGEKSLGSLSIYPNPASEFINCSLESLSSGEIRIEIVNSLGEIVEKRDKVFLSGRNQSGIIQFSLEDFPDGIYFLNLYTEDTVYTKEFVKQ